MVSESPKKSREPLKPWEKIAGCVIVLPVAIVVLVVIYAVCFKAIMLILGWL